MGAPPPAVKEELRILPQLKFMSNNTHHHPEQFSETLKLPTNAIVGLNAAMLEQFDLENARNRR